MRTETGSWMCWRRPLGVPVGWSSSVGGAARHRRPCWRPGPPRPRHPRPLPPWNREPVDGRTQRSDHNRRSQVSELPPTVLFTPFAPQMDRQLLQPAPVSRSQQCPQQRAPDRTARMLHHSLDSLEDALAAVAYCN